MLWFQVGAIDLNRPDTKLRSKERAVRVNRPYLSWTSSIWLLSAVLSILIGLPYASAQSKGRKGKPPAKAAPSSSPGEQSLTNIPLPIGHEAKGLVLPDFDLEGHLRGRFEAVSAKRFDEEHIGFHSLKITTYTPENKTDRTIELSESILNLKTRILSSKERTIIKR